MKAEFLSVKWQKAAVIGSIWAAIEIVAGSFLHNLRIPFAGMFLATASVFLLISFLHLWKENGIIIRAGLICALMKSVSPSAIIFGPMIGIFTEALIIEGVLLMLGKNRISYVIAGGLAVLWTLLQKILNMLILYGFDLIQLISSLYDFLQKQTGLQQLGLWQLLFAVALLYFSAGATAAVLAMINANSSKMANSHTTWPIKLNTATNGPMSSNANQYRLRNLLLIFVVMVFLLFAINRKWTIISVSGAVLFLTFCVLRYRQSLRQLQKPGLWIQFALITAAAVLTWEWVSSGTLFSKKGLYVALDMNIRAMILIFGFAAIGVELRNPLLRTMFSTRGAQPLYAALNLSFSALPAIMEQLQHPVAFIRKRKTLMATMMLLAQQLLVRFNILSGSSKHILITGEVHQGKSSFMNELADKLKQKEFKIAGFLAPALFANGERIGYSLLSLSDGTQITVASKLFQPGWQKTRRFWFNPQAFESGKNWVENALANEIDLIIIDEIGPLEIAGEGWDSLLRKTTDNCNCLQIWVVRKQLLDQVIERYELKNPAVLAIDSTTTEELLVFLMQHKL
jgi:nucleoside-triphosphatase THEP1